ncbi:MAG: hypothetical protein QXH08_06270, partial [Candidatus Hadarchaeales archaeon]
LLGGVTSPLVLSHVILYLREKMLAGVLAPFFPNGIFYLISKYPIATTSERNACPRVGSIQILCMIGPRCFNFAREKGHDIFIISFPATVRGDKAVAMKLAPQRSRNKDMAR